MQTSKQNGHASKAVATASHEIHSFLTDVEDMIKSATSLTGEDLAKVKAKIGESVSVAKKSMEDMSGVVADRTRKAAAEANDFAHEQPWKVIGLGAILGLLIGLALSRGSSRAE